MQWFAPRDERRPQVIKKDADPGNVSEEASEPDARSGGRWGYRRAAVSPDKPAAGAQSSVRDRAASLPIGRSTRRCAGWRTAPGTWSPENPWTGKSGRYRNPRR